MRLSDLLDAKIKTPDGAVLGRVHEVHCDGGRVVALMCGPAGLVERWTGKSKGRTIPWKSVRKLARDGIVVELEAGTTHKATKN
jgi:sporulation protein YlmC with PRC-barrel domain